MAYYHHGIDVERCRIFVATLLSFISAALAATHKLCYTALASSSVVLILPGFIVLTGSLELASRNIISGAVRICYSLIYSLFLGFGLSMGAEIFTNMTSERVFGSEDYMCEFSHGSGEGAWWRRTVGGWWWVLGVPMYSVCLAIRNQAPILTKEMVCAVFLIFLSKGGGI
jgi:hypothetical protein